MASFEHLFTTNQAPTDDERVRLKKTVADCDDKLCVITQKISALEAQLRSLNKEKTTLLEASEPFRRALSPFRQLPEDVVRAIFVACLETRWNPTMANTEAPVLLTQISRATRMIALTTPELWAAIHIPIVIAVRLDVMHTARSIMTARAKGVEEWLLRRSGNLPLHISVYEIREDSNRGCELTSKIIDILIACCSRWKSIHFSCRPTTLFRVSSLTRFDVPLLQSLAISSLTYFLDVNNFWRDSGILKSPMLKKFHQLGDIVTAIYPLNWSTLTHFSCDHACHNIIDDLVGVLCQAAGLISLDLTLMAYSYELPHFAGTISLPCLRTLLFADFGPVGEGMGVLGLIYAPSLEAISYNTNMDDIARSPPLIACLKRSPNVRELSTGRPCASDILLEYLSHCPALLTLHVRQVRFAMDRPWIKPDNDAFLRAFVQDDATQCLCPQLEYFRFEPTLAVPLRTLRHFLVRRQGADPNLSRWKAVVANVEYDAADEALIEKIHSVEVAGDIRLVMSFKKSQPTTYNAQNLDQGIVPAISSIDDWWPSAIVNEISYLS